MNLVQKLSRITLICSDPDWLAEFYECAFGFVRTGETLIAEPAFAQLMGIAGATGRSITLQLGEQEMELLVVHPRGRPYPRPISGRSALFQHFAIVVSEMGRACERLSAHGGWTTISTDGPQLLPASSGGVTAYKFRDPEGHPLELIAFPTRRHTREVAKVFCGGMHRYRSFCDFDCCYGEECHILRTAGISAHWWLAQHRSSAGKARRCCGSSRQGHSVGASDNFQPLTSNCSAIEVVSMAKQLFPTRMTLRRLAL